MDYAALVAELQSGPLATEIAAAEGNQSIADLLNDPSKGGVILIATFVNARTLMSKVGAEKGATILEKLTALVPSNPVIKWTMSFITSEGGINLGDPQTQGMIDQLAAAGALDQTTEAAPLKALGQKQGSRAEQLFGVGTILTDRDIYVALGG